MDRKPNSAAGNAGCTSDPPWTPFVRDVAIPLDESQLRELAELAGVSVDVARAIEEEERRECAIFLNSRYQVAVRKLGPGPARQTMQHLSIKRLDKAPIRDWRDLQRVKNELVGAEFEAVEIYPAESRKVDTSNQYHLWVFPEGHRLPFGFGERAVIHGEAGGSRQRRPD